ncbi:hypothetical protein EV360DRAFT_57929 [Lentinula raphanica]|nr:hypothetical protein EV360DRAFT_57929 [Lentinula raphanica]
MALDFLSAPATSTDVERLFSHAGLVVAKRRYNLAPIHIRQSTILNNWLKMDNLVPRSICRTKLNTKFGKPKGQRPSSDSEWSSSDIEVQEVEAAKDDTNSTDSGSGGESDDE